MTQELDRTPAAWVSGMPFGLWCGRSGVQTSRAVFLFHLNYKWEGCRLRCFKDPTPHSFWDPPTSWTWNTKSYPIESCHWVGWVRCERRSYCSHSGFLRPVEGHHRTPGLGEGPMLHWRQTQIRKMGSRVQKNKTGAFHLLNQERKIVSILGKREMYLTAQRKTKQLLN